MRTNTFQVLVAAIILMAVIAVGRAVLSGGTVQTDSPVSLQGIPESSGLAHFRAVEVSMPIVKTPTRKNINPNDGRNQETPKECFDRLECGKKGSITGCYNCCIGCDTANQTKCQDYCDGSTSALTGWPIEQLQAMRANHAEYMNAVHEAFNAEHTVQNAHRIAYLFAIGGVETLADTRCTVAIAAGAIPNAAPDAADVYDAVLQDALKDPRDPAIRRTALACLTTAWGNDSVEAMQEITNAAIQDDDQSVRDLAIRLMTKWL